MDTLFHQTMTALEQVLQCRLIATELDYVRGIRPLDATDAEILELALPQRYSRIPLYSQEQHLQNSITHVALVDLIAERVTIRREITGEDVIVGSTPISMAIELLSQRPFYFVLDSDRIRRILTRSDLNRLPVRTYLHTLLDHLEGLMALWCDQQYPDNAWKQNLCLQLQAKIEGLQKQKQDMDFDTALIDCTFLKDKGLIFEATAELRGKLGFSEALDFRREFKAINVLRNQLDHGGPLVKKGDMEWLNGVVSTIHTWIAALSEEDKGQAEHGA